MSSHPTITRAASLMLAAGATFALGACSATPTASAPGAAAATSAAPTSPKAGKVRVADLMKRAGCKGKVIGTQLYSRETGRCNMPGGGEVTFAVFDTADLRDQWVAVGKSFGGNYAQGADWAAAADSPDDAAAWAAKLNGTVL